MAYSNFGAQFQAFVIRVAEVCKNFVTIDALTTALSNKLDKTGTASAATKATQDASGNTITSSYAASLSGDSTDTVTLKSKSGAELSKITVNNVAKATSADSATKATQLANSRNISLTGDASGSTGFNGTGDASISVTLANSGVSAGTSGPSANVTIAKNSSGSFVVPYFTTDAKGRVTARGTRTISITTGGDGLANIGAQTFSKSAGPKKSSICQITVSASRDAYGRLTEVGASTKTTCDQCLTCDGN